MENNITETNIIRVEAADKNTFKFLYANWAMTWEGLIESDFQTAINECGTEDTKGYVISGKDMNKHYKLTGSNAYPDDLTIFAIYPFTGLAMMYGARWFTDIVDNNKIHNKRR